MKLSTKYFIILLLVTVISILLNYSIVHSIVFPGFVDLENSEAIKDAERSVEAINNEIKHLNGFCSDWSAWDDSYQFVIDLNEDYVSSNLTESSFLDNRLSLIYYFDENFKVVWGQAYDVREEHWTEFDEFSTSTDFHEHPLFKYDPELDDPAELEVAGVMQTSRGPMMVSSRPIITSENRGPLHGYMVMGIMLDEELIKTLRQQTRVSFRIHDVLDEYLSSQQKESIRQISAKNPFAVNTIDDNKIMVSGLIRNIENKPHLLLEAEIARSITTVGKSIVGFAFFSIALSGLFTIVVLLLSTGLLVIRPTTKLIDRVSKLAATNDLSLRLEVDRKDELGRLIVYLNQLLETLEEAVEDRQKMTERIQEVQKKESLSLLAGGIAHDFNNLLVGVLGNADLALEDLPPDSPVRGYLRDIENTAQRASDLTKQMLAYSGKGHFILENLNLSDLIRDMANFFRSTISKKARLEFFLDDKLPSINGDQIQIKQLLINLIVNASESLNDRDGLISIITDTQSVKNGLKEKHSFGRELNDGEYVCLSIKDSGCGMTPESIRKMFDPFYSTKFTGRGLGLAATLGIIEGHKGAVSVQSAPDIGTTMTVYLPVSGPYISKSEDTQIKKSVGRKGSGTILIADDEPMVLTFAQTVLERTGYKVFTVSDGQKAVDVFRRKSAEIDLVLLDLTMPKLSGEEVYDEIVRIKPNILVLISSGYNEVEARGRFAERAVLSFIQKPYKPSQLFTKVTELLEGD